jgi:hypothetical protein
MENRDAHSLTKPRSHSSVLPSHPPSPCHLLIYLSYAPSCSLRLFPWFLSRLRHHPNNCDHYALPHPLKRHEERVRPRTEPRIPCVCSHVSFVQIGYDWPFFVRGITRSALADACLDSGVKWRAGYGFSIDSDGCDLQVDVARRHFAIGWKADVGQMRAAAVYSTVGQSRVLTAVCFGCGAVRALGWCFENRTRCSRRGSGSGLPMTMSAKKMWMRNLAGEWGSRRRWYVWGQLRWGEGRSEKNEG